MKREVREVPFAVWVAKLNKSVSVDQSKWTDQAFDNAMEVGLGRILNDAHAGITRTTHPDDAARTAAIQVAIDTRLANLANGDVRTSNNVAAQLAAAMARIAELEAQVVKTVKRVA